MKQALLLVWVMVVFPPGLGADGEAPRMGMARFRKHRDHDAARLMYAQLAAAPTGQQLDTRRNFGMVCMANATFYAGLHQAARSLQVAYLERLMQADAAPESASSRLAGLYLGEALLADGRALPAISTLTRFLNTHRTNDTDRIEAQVALGAAYYAAGQRHRAGNIWSNVPASLPHAAALPAAAYREAGIRADKIMPLAGKDPIPVQCASAFLDIYDHGNGVGKGFEIFARTRLERFAREEVVDAHKVLRFYDAELLHPLSVFYNQAARDNSRKNRIDANPPVLLADLAWAYYRNRQFSEALEIYFTMGRHFPAVRQIQVALQGMCSMEQQSAGDAKIF